MTSFFKSQCRTVREMIEAIKDLPENLPVEGATSEIVLLELERKFCQEGEPMLTLTIHIGCPQQA